MKIAVELFTGTSGWTWNGGAGFTVTLNAHPEFIADRLPNSCIFHIPAGSLGKTFQKTVNVPTVAAGYPEIVFNVWSRGKRSDTFKKYSDFFYQVSFDNGAHSYYFPTWPKFGDVTIAPAGTPVTTIIFTVLHNDEDWLVLSDMIGVIDESPLDILNAIQNDLALQSVAQYPLGFPTGDTITANLGDQTVTFQGNHDFLGRYRLVGFGGETHIIEEWEEGRATFKTSWDGASVKANQVAAPVYVQFPVSITLGETDLLLPVIALDAMHPEPVLRTSGVQRVADTFAASGAAQDAAAFLERQEDMLLSFPILIDVEAQEYELLARANRIVRAFLAQYGTWINGRKHDFLFDNPPTDVEPDSVNETLPKTQYVLDIVARETVASRQALARFVNFNETWTIVRPAASSTGPFVPAYGP